MKIRPFLRSIWRRTPIYYFLEWYFCWDIHEQLRELDRQIAVVEQSERERSNQVVDMRETVSNHFQQLSGSEQQKIFAAIWRYEQARRDSEGRRENG